MDGRGSEMNERLYGYAVTEPKIGDLIEFGVSAGLPLLLRAVVRNQTKEGFGVEFVAETSVERHDLGLFRQFVRAAAGYTDA